QRQALSHTIQNQLNSYNKRLKDDIRSMLDNFCEIIKSGKVDENQQLDRATQNYYDVYQMRVRSANIVRAGESLLRLIAELKTFLILNDFPSINRHIEAQNNHLNLVSGKWNEQLVRLRDEASVVLHDLESELYSSIRP
uniref:Mediator of RNA polymerase II transcription subunit 22 n=2 Tax=Ciona intestinalis TaxID=7719 RepID=F6UPP6_CIOIN